MSEWIYGRNPVYETLRAGRRRAGRLLVAKGAQEKGRLAEIIAFCRERKIPVEYTGRGRLDTLAPVSQGVALQVDNYPYSDLGAILRRAQDRDEPPFLLLLDTLQDPHNLGSLLRTAEAVGVHGVILPARRAATVTPAVVSVSSGASEHLLIAQMNLAQSIELLKQEGLWVVGLEGGPAALSPEAVNLSGPLAIVVGNEAQGLRPLVQKSCDWLLRLPMRGQIDSLNAAVAGSVALYLAWQTRAYSGVREIAAIDDSGES